jgi:hypothetical protein
MKLRYYLRGLGIGVVVTAIIMTVALGNKRPMTDEEVIKRAKELGMIENSVLADRTDEAVESIGDEVVDHEADDNEVVDQEVADHDTDVEETIQNETTEEESSKEESSKEETTKDVVSITVVGGDTSWSVSKRMEEAGLIDSAKDFDAHLCRYGYDKKISVGTYDIPKTATHEDMAKIITKTD